MKFTSTAKALAALVTALALSFVGLAVASACTGDLNATAACQADGKYLVTYTLTTANTNLAGETWWRVGNTTFDATPTSTNDLKNGPVDSNGAQTITLGTTTVPGNWTWSPWAYAYTTWTGNQKGSDGGHIELGGTCKPQPDTKVVVPGEYGGAAPTCTTPSVVWTRTLTTTTYAYVWNTKTGVWDMVTATPVVTTDPVTQRVALTADQVKACHPMLPPTVESGSQTCTVGDQGQPSLTGGQIVLGTSDGVSTKVMKDGVEVSPLTGLLPGTTYVVVASLNDAANSSWGTLPTGWTLNTIDGTVSFSVTIGAADLTQCTVDQPKAVITYGNLMGAPTCENPSIKQTRDVFTAVYSWIKGGWVLGTAVKTSATTTQSMALTADQVKACTINLTLTKTVISDGPYYAGSQVTYQLAPHNDGPGNALAGWSVTDILPVGMTLGTLGSISGDGYTCDTTSLTCTSSHALAAGATGSPITVFAQIRQDDQPGTLKNVAYVSPAKGDVPETNPLVIPTLATDTSASVTDNDAQAAIDVVPPQVQGESIVITLPNTGTTIPLTWLLGAIGIVAAGVILLGASRFNARGRRS